MWLLAVGDKELGTICVRAVTSHRDDTSSGVLWNTGQGYMWEYHQLLYSPRFIAKIMNKNLNKIPL